MVLLGLRPRSSKLLVDPLCVALCQKKSYLGIISKVSSLLPKHLRATRGRQAPGLHNQQNHPTSKNRLCRSGGKQRSCSTINILRISKGYRRSRFGSHTGRPQPQLSAFTEVPHSRAVLGEMFFLFHSSSMMVNVQNKFRF